jgi:hypothetical protein
MDDGNEVVAKLSCPNAGPPSLTTASEVATLKFRALNLLNADEYSFAKLTFVFK